MDQLAEFRRDLLAWYAEFRRDLPWRRTTNWYAIWVSEIMLQQTRVAVVIPYYERFLRRFPSVEALARAPETDLLSHWAGLGYYARARNMQRAAQEIVKSGSIPSSHEAILALPGIGSYTAAAVASIAFNLPHAVLDGNVFRVLSRVFADETNIASSAGKKRFAELANAVLDRERPGLFNQAMMELGATVCLPKGPQCLLCPVAAHCRARAERRTDELPVKVIEKRVSQERAVYWIERANQILMWQRPADSRFMPGFWELPEGEQLPEVKARILLGEFKHAITIHDYRFRVFKADVPSDCSICEWKPLASASIDAVPAPMSTIFRKARRVVENRKTPLSVSSGELKSPIEC